MEALATRLAAEGVARAAQVLQPVLDDVFDLSAGQPPAKREVRRRRPDPAEAGRPDSHNARAALLLSIEDAIERAPDATARTALMAALRRALDTKKGG